MAEGRRHRASASSSGGRCCTRLPQTKRTWLELSRRRVQRRQSVPARQPEGRSGDRTVAVESSRTARRRWRMLADAWAARLPRRAASACGRSQQTLRSHRPQARPVDPGRRTGRSRSPRSMSTSPPTTSWSRRSSKGARDDRLRHLRHGPDGHPPRDLHAVPAALRASARAVAAAAPAFRRSLRCSPMSLKLIDRARLKEINHRLLLGHRRHPHGAEAAGRQLRRRAPSRRNIRPGARKAIARDKAEGRRVVMATASYRLYAAAIAERLGFDDVIGTGSIIGLDERVHAKIDGENCYGPAKLRMVADWLEQERPRARPRPLLFRPCQRRAGVRMGGRGGRGEPARPAEAPGCRAGLDSRGLELASASGPLQTFGCDAKVA